MKNEMAKLAEAEKHRKSMVGGPQGRRNKNKSTPMASRGSSYVPWNQKYKDGETLNR